MALAKRLHESRNLAIGQRTAMPDIIFLSRWNEGRARHGKSQLSRYVVLASVAPRYPQCGGMGQLEHSCRGRVYSCRPSNRPLAPARRGVGNPAAPNDGPTARRISVI